MLTIQLLRDGNRDIWRLRLDGSDTLLLTTHAAEDTRPSIAAGQVVFVSVRDGNAELYQVPATGGEAQRLTTSPANELDPALSPDGRQLAFTFDSSGSPRLFLSAADGSQRRALTTTFGLSGALDATPAWNAAGSELAFTTTSGGQTVVARVSTGAGAPAPSMLIASQPPNAEPSWSRDGSQVAFVSNRDSDAELYLYTVATGAVTRLTRRPGIDRRPQFLPDGRLLWLAESGGEWRIMWADVDRPEVTHEVPTPAGIVEWVSAER